MIKKLMTVVIVTLALNFLAVAGGIGWLYQNGKLQHEQVMAIKEILFPPPATQPATQPVEEATTQPSHRLEDLLAKASGRTATEQVEFIRSSFDLQMAVLDRRERGLMDRERVLEVAAEQLVKDRAELENKGKALDSREKQALALASDKGFQDSLALYNTMPPAQVKRIFSGLDDRTVMNYLQAMQPRKAATIIKEFTSPDETERMQHILERMRQASASSKE